MSSLTAGQLDPPSLTGEITSGDRDGHLWARSVSRKWTLTPECDGLISSLAPQRLKGHTALAALRQCSHLAGRLTVLCAGL